MPGFALCRRRGGRKILFYFFFFQWLDLSWIVLCRVSRLAEEKIVSCFRNFSTERGFEFSFLFFWSRKLASKQWVELVWILLSAILVSFQRKAFVGHVQKKFLSGPSVHGFITFPNIFLDDFIRMILKSEINVESRVSNFFGSYLNEINKFFYDVCVYK